MKKYRLWEPWVTMLLLHLNNSIVCFHYHLHFLRCLQRSQVQQQKFCTRVKTRFSLNKKWCAQQRWIKIASLSRADMCNPQPAALFGAACMVLFMILKWYFKLTIFLTFSCHSFQNYLPQAFAFHQRFTALQVHEQGPATFLITWEWEQ